MTATPETLRPCAACGKSLEGRQAHAKVCNPRCYKRAARLARRAGRTCATCGESIAHRAAHATFCSRRCLNKARWQREKGEPKRKLGCSPERAQAIADLLRESPMLGLVRGGRE